jgi:hypothetical protein
MSGLPGVLQCPIVDEEVLGADFQAESEGEMRLLPSGDGWWNSNNTLERKGWSWSSMGQGYGRIDRVQHLSMIVSKASDPFK